MPTKEEGNENLKFLLNRNISKYIVLSLILYGNIDYAFDLLEKERKHKK
jgi:hypothetical protein